VTSTSVEPAKSEPAPEKPEKPKGPTIGARLYALVVAIGLPVVRAIVELGHMVIFVGQVLFWLPRRPIRWSEILRLCRDVGFGSLFIVILTGFFTGLVFGIQTLVGFRRFGAEALVGPATLISLAREMGPVLTALMVAGRSGSGMATELGTMRVTEQIDALSTMAVEPIQYLVVPRLIAATLMVPMLASIFTGCGFLGSFIMAVGREGVDPGVFLYETYNILDPPDFIEGYVKAAFFGAQISLISCYKGFNTSGGARGVGQAATAAVVYSSVSILVGTYLLTELLQPILYGYIYFDSLPK
jgi:phospholipid/cholesterol/gamma-HCH transport system permease protein